MKRKWQPSSPELIACFDACLPHAAGVERRQMFGYPCAFVKERAPRELGRWIKKALAYAQALPPKASKKAAATRSR